MLTLWVWLHIVGHEFGKGTEFVAASKAPFDPDAKKQSHQCHLFPSTLLLSQHHLLIKIWDLITFSSCF